MTNTPRRFDENPNTTTNLQKDSTEYFGISQSGASKVIKTSDAFTKANVGLSEVDNTSDANKPVSVAQQTALDLKADELDVTTALNLKADKSELLTLGEVTGTAYDGAKGKANADAIQDLDTNKADKSDTYTKSEVDIELAKKADIEQEDWIEPTLLNGWTGTVKYRKNNFGAVDVDISLNGTGISGSIIFNFVGGYIPTTETRAILASNIVGSGVYFVINVAGGVTGYKETTSTKMVGSFTMFNVLGV